MYKNQGPKFLIKLYNILKDVENIDVIYWNNSGDAFEISNQESLIKKVLTVHFKQTNFQSFVRQLNQYGFCKQKLDRNIVSFKHKYFKQNEEQLLQKIQSSHKLKTQSFKTQQIDNIIRDLDQKQILRIDLKELQQNQLMIFKQLQDQMDVQQQIKQYIFQLKEKIANFSFSIEQYCYIAQNLLIQVLNQIPNNATYKYEIELLKRVLQEFSDIYIEYYVINQNQISPNNSVRCLTPAPFYLNEQQKKEIGLINNNKKELQKQIEEYLIWVKQSYEEAIQKTQI